MAWKNLSDRMLRTTLKTFNDADNAITYTRGGVSVPLSQAIYDDNYQSVDPDTGAPITSTNPMLGVRLADLPDGKAMKGDQIVRNGITYRVLEQQPDSEGHAKLILAKR